MNNFNTFLTHAGFSSSDVETIIASFTKKKLSKGDYFVKEGKTATQLAFVERGMFQYYSVSEKGEEITTYISGEKTFIASLLSFFTNTPARENIKALTDADVWVISKQQFGMLQSELPAFKDFYIQLLEWQICCIDKGKFDLISLSAEQRYNKLLEEEPGVLQQVPLQLIASMMGITPRHLSRLRGKN